MPEPEELTEDWAQSVTPEYATLLSAAPVEDGSKRAIADTITAGILLTSWLFNLDKGQYLKPRTREPITQAELNLLLRDRVADGKRNLDKISKAYQQTPNLRMWEGRAEAEIRRLHTELYLLGRGGLNQVDAADVERLRDRLTEQSRYLQNFKRDLAAGKPSDLRSLNRLRMYADSAISAYNAGREAAMVAAGLTESRRYLSPAENCPDCVEYADLGWQAIGVLPLPKTESECVFNCLCRIEYR